MTVESTPGADPVVASLREQIDAVDRELLDTLCRRFVGRPVGLTTLAVSVGEDPETIEDVYEPYLLQRGLIQRTPRGRIATPSAFAHLGLPEPILDAPAVTPEGTPSLFSS